MSKHYDVYLNGHLTQHNLFLWGKRKQGNIIISSLPLHITVSAYGRIILNCMTGHSALQKSVSARHEFVFTTSAGNTLKRFLQMLNYGVSICTEANAGMLQAVSVGRNTINGDHTGRASLRVQNVAEKTAAQISCTASTSIVRLRRLCELDNNALIDMDGRMLKELDYVILEE